MKETALWPHQNELIERAMRTQRALVRLKLLKYQKTMQVFEEQFLDILPKLRSDFFDGFLPGIYVITAA